MGLSTRFSRTLFTATIAAVSALGLGACGPDYSLFRVHVSIQAANQSELDGISFCKMSVFTDNDEQVPVLKDFLLATSFNGSDLVAGCSAGLTKSTVGDFSYSTSRKGGALKFRVNAYSDSTSNGNNIVLKTGASEMVQVAPYPPEIKVPITAKNP
jgi:hypothetical protein